MYILQNNPFSFFVLCSVVPYCTSIDPSIPFVLDPEHAEAITLFWGQTVGYGVGQEFNRLLPRPLDQSPCSNRP